MIFKGMAKIIYDPYRGDMKANTDWWCVAKIDDEICRYYRWWVWNRYMIDLQKPSWGGHISIVRGEVPREQFQSGWKKYAGEKMEFEYSHNVRFTGDTTGGDRSDTFWFIDVWCPTFNKIRKELGLNWKYPDGSLFKFHVTVGRT